MKILVIPDIHHKWRLAERIIAHERGNYDKIVFLGDYFDDFGDNAKISGETADWLKTSIEVENRIHLLGNHDMPYAFSHNQHVSCSGFTHEKCREINSRLNHMDWAKLSLAYFKDGVMYSHAGFSRRLFEHPVNGMESSSVLEILERAINCARGGIYTCYLGVGMSRGGSQMQGGVTWAHWYSDIDPINDWSMVVGHTTVGQPTYKWMPNRRKAKRYCLNIDTQLKYYAIIEDGVAHCKQTPTELLKE
jgi:hypothetical protein